MRKILVFLILALVLLAAPVMAADQSAADQTVTNQGAANQSSVSSVVLGTNSDAGMGAKLGWLNLKFLGYIEAASIYRDKNLSSDMGTPFAKIPLPNTANYYQDEVRFSARGSRLGLLGTTDYSPVTHLALYYEMDFKGAGQTANSNQSNAYAPAIRQLFATIDWDDYGLHLLGGQAWSLVTMNDKGITPRNENIPLTIDAAYVAGFDFARQPQFRIVKDWNKQIWLALSVENPQTTAAGDLPSNLNLSTNMTISSPPTNMSIPGNYFDSGTKISANNYPDFVLKAAYEPGWGHFEVFDLFRNFESTVASGTAAGSTVSNKNITANSVGAGAILPVIPGNLKLQLSALYGEGIGRYGASQLPDVTEDSLGNIHPITALHYLFGVVWDPNSTWNIYGYYGEEQALRNTYNVGSTAYGYGSILDNDSGCTTYGGTCKGVVKTVYDATFGVWWKFYQGKFGKMMYGVQYSYVDDKYFSTKTGTPNTNDQIVFTSLRFYW